MEIDGKTCTKCSVFKAMDSFYPGRADCKQCKNRQTVSRRQARQKDNPEAHASMLDANRLRLREYRKIKPEQFKLYRRRYLSHPENRERKKWRQRASRAGVTSKVLNGVWERDLGMCQMCGSEENPHIDHILPVSLSYGVQSSDDLQILCRDCNLFKSNHIMLFGGGMMISKRKDFQ